MEFKVRDSGEEKFLEDTAEAALKQREGQCYEEALQNKAVGLSGYFGGPDGVLLDKELQFVPEICIIEFWLKGSRGGSCNKASSRK